MHIKWTRILGCLLSFVFPSLLLIVLVLPDTWLPEKVSNILLFVFAILSLIFLFTFIYQWFAEPIKAYALREQDLSYQSGLLFRKVITQPITRIQHVELKRGPLDRRNELAKLQVFSAGGAMHTFEIPGLELKTAQSIRQFILSHKGGNNDG
ncbi:PH domain-containing protein [Thalassotalea mangrovi]|uniref:PH domain-containing protein n=2 Tax=Thalassotalea mangrovi TaxID=2572245 RepID=A0A4U1B7F4_9GAMM|nr:PH domain-containing protein [Thalassotalea mangrovi]